MTGIERVGRPMAPRVTNRPASKSGFFVPEAAGPDQAGAAAAPAATSLGSMLALQEAGGEAVADREARRHGNDMLAALSCNGRCWAAVTMGWRCSGWQTWRPRCHLPRTRGWPP